MGLSGRALPALFPSEDRIMFIRNPRPTNARSKENPTFG
jgi:hypothetical protein